jgi:hypothetical protein
MVLGVDVAESIDASGRPQRGQTVEVIPLILPLAFKIAC